MNFKDQLAKDLKNVFFNQDEFAEYIDIDGQQVLAIIGSDQFHERPRHPEELYNITHGIYQSSITILVKSDDFEKPAVGQQIYINGEDYLVVSVSEESGVLKINAMTNEA
ncbi:hypothetical protein [Parageobacillus toebii]|jgi:hypothetical protein|uniref:Uncharacterized protein n=1 Tax=Parageobacillus toebii TaxID=153151 RepID=A0A150MJA9_9BACL|nr:hypothetical protein [Parageobacillus toebii]KYD24610.1 hypothetical protein B4110_0619 [Parageobacillus toebii]